MKLAFFADGSLRQNWLGDKQALRLLKQGLENLGHRATISDDIADVIPADHIFLSNIFHDLNPKATALSLLGKSYSLISFHENYLDYWGPCAAFYSAVLTSLQKGQEPWLDFLLEAPDHIRFFSPPPRRYPLINYNVMQQALFCVANSPTEKETILRDCPRARAEVVFWGPGQLTGQTPPYDASFTAHSGLSAGSYILQVGRFAPQKNQLASILATRNLDIPLVFFANYLFFKDYTQACLDAIVKWRKAPTLVYTSALPSEVRGPLRIIHMPSEHDLSQNLLISAYQNAGLYLHPAFTELPGFVSLEAAKLGTPVVTSSWTTLRDYFTDERGAYTLDGRIAYAQKPYDITEIESLIVEQFGKRYPSDSHPAFKRDATQMAQDLLNYLIKYRTDLHK